MFNHIIFLFTIVFGLGAMISYLNNSARLQLREIDTTEKRIFYRKQIYKKRIKTIFEVASAPIIILVFVWIGLMSIPSSTNDTKDLKMWFWDVLLSFTHHYNYSWPPRIIHVHSIQGKYVVL